MCCGTVKGKMQNTINCNIKLLDCQMRNLFMLLTSNVQQIIYAQAQQQQWIVNITFSKRVIFGWGISCPVNNSCKNEQD